MPKITICKNGRLDAKFLVSQCIITRLSYIVATNLLTALANDVPDFNYKIVEDKMCTWYNIEFIYTGHNYYISLAILEFFLKGYFQGINESLDFIK